MLLLNWIALNNLVVYGEFRPRMNCKYNNLDGDEDGESYATKAYKWIAGVNYIFKPQEGYGVEYQEDYEGKITLVFRQ